MMRPVFPTVALERGMYESFYLRAVSPDEPLGIWIRYTVHKRPGHVARGSVWCTLFDASRGSPFMHKRSSEELSVPPSAWIAIGADSYIGPELAKGNCGPARWSLRFTARAGELRHLRPAWLYRSPVPRTKLSSPIPTGSFNGEIELPDRTVELRSWSGMVGHNWGSEHAERWIWLHGLDFEQEHSAWIDAALARVRVAGRLIPWRACGELSIGGKRTPLGGLSARGVRVAESARRCSIALPAQGGVWVQAHLDVPASAAAGWRYADPDGGEHDVIHCSVASLTLNVHPPGQAATTLHSKHAAAYELGMLERDHGVPLAPFRDG